MNNLKSKAPLIESSWAFLCKKILILLVSLICVISGTFIIAKMLPGSPFMDDRTPSDVLKIIHTHYGLDQPLLVQYFKYLQGMLTFDLGYSLVYPGQAVSQIISDSFPISARLGLQALCLSIPTGILLGVWAAIKRSRWQDHTAMIFSTLGISVPSFVIASLLQYIISFRLHLLPGAQWGTFAHTILPTLALAATPAAFIMRLTRSNMVDILQQDFIRTAVSKGLPPFRIAIIHGLRNALLPVISYIGTITVQIFTGSFIIEKIFAIPGLGVWLITSICNRDYPVILGITAFYGSLLFIVIFLADILHSIIDPRIRICNHKDLS